MYQIAEDRIKRADADEHHEPIMLESIIGKDAYAKLLEDDEQAQDDDLFDD